MADEQPSAKVATRPRIGFGTWALIVALVAFVVLALLPAPYVIYRPGPVYNTLGTVTDADGEQMALISIDGARTYPADGALNLTTIEVLGNRQQSPSWVEITSAWFDPARAVVPVDLVFPEGVTPEQRNEENAMHMENSQATATAAALLALGYDVSAELSVGDLTADSPAEGILEPGDVILEVDGRAPSSLAEFRGWIQESAGDPLTLTIDRRGRQQSVEVAPELQDDTWMLGVLVGAEYAFPVDVTIQLDRVGGSSAGMMFALGIIDELTPGDLTGGAQIAGTGTIDDGGNVGPIGGIRQKMYGARDAGSEFFLAPATNCDQVVGHIPDGLRVIRTSTLEESLAALEVIADGGDVASLPTCATALAR